MRVWIHIWSGSKEPISIQIAEGISQTIARGELSYGDKLPSIRKLAAELVVNPNTVAKAYSNLEENGLVTVKAGSGTYVNNLKNRQIKKKDMQLLKRKTEALITEGLNLGIEPEQLKMNFNTVLEEFVNQRNNKRDKNE
ncbi:MAG: GntR family transcriptional regulator [Planctomycetota bacterium]|jgi:GntR family transcriptional regulator